LRAPPNTLYVEFVTWVEPLHFACRPAVNPPKEVIDPTDEKPNDWDEREK